VTFNESLAAAYGKTRLPPGASRSFPRQGRTAWPAAITSWHMDDRDEETASLTQQAVRRWMPVIDESDRGAVLVGAALLDSALEKLLRAQFVKEPAVVSKVIDPLFADFGAFSNTAIKEKIVEAMGLLHRDTLAQLKQIRKLRNGFAHTVDAVTLEMANVQAVARLLNPERRAWIEAWAQTLTNVGPEPGQASPMTTARIWFSLIVFEVLSDIERATSGVRPPNPTSQS
jgi:hypothetical protein